MRRPCRAVSPVAVAGALALALTATACGGTTSEAAGSGASPTGSGALDPTSFALQLASSDLYAGTPQRVQLGILSSTETSGVLMVTSGTVEVAVGPTGAGSTVQLSARYVPAPGTAGGEAGDPQLTTPDVARGVYQADDVTFDAPGVWQADVTFALQGTPVSLSTQFPVATKPSLPAPGQDALRTQNLTMTNSKGDPQAIDSRAQGTTPVPDPELHATTIADAIAAHRPVLALFATPVYCQSQFCGPSVDALEQMAKARPDAAAYIHVEIWHDYAKSELNRAAADWLLREGDLTEPWLFLIGPDGSIVDRWGPLFDPAQVMAELDALPVD